MPVIRADAARSRARILDAARTTDAAELRFNDLAKEAGVGVGTVYRHFPNVHAIVEALALETLRELDDRMTAAEALDEPAVALFELLESALDLQLRDGGLQAVLLSDADESDEVRTLKTAVMSSFVRVLERARADGVIRPEVTAERLQHLVCGIEHAVRLGAPEDRNLFLTVMLAGLRVED